MPNHRLEKDFCYAAASQKPLKRPFCDFEYYGGKMLKKRASVFIGSSSEGLPIAEAVQVNLEDTCDTVIWSQGVFGLSQGTMEALVEDLPTFDFAILILTADDMIQVRNEISQSPRDNVLLEFGLCVGILGRERTFAVYDRKSKIRIPSDLAGVTLATYQLQHGRDFQASLGATTSKIKSEIRKLRPRATGVSEVPNSAFLAVPMNAFNVAGKPHDYEVFREKLLSLIDGLRTECDITPVFCAAEDISDTNKFDLPGASLAIDIDNIHKHEFFILIWMRDVASKSVLIETGMALAMGKKCFICVERGAVLPFILQDASSAVKNVKIINYETIDKLAFNFKKNKRWLFNFQRKGKDLST